MYDHDDNDYRIRQLEETIEQMQDAIFELQYDLNRERNERKSQEMELERQIESIKYALPE